MNAHKCRIEHDEGSSRSVGVAAEYTLESLSETSLEDGKAEIHRREARALVSGGSSWPTGHVAR